MDITAWQKKEIGIDEETAAHKKPISIQRAFNCTTIASLSRMINPPAMWRSVYFMLEKNQASDEFQDRWSWPIALQGTQEATQRAIRVQQLPSNIVAIHISVVKITFNEPTNTLVGLNNRFGILVDECAIQSSQIADVRLHFLLKNFISALPPERPISYPQNSNLCAFGTYWFHPPILAMTSITLSLFDPLNRILNAQVNELHVGLEIICS